MSSRLISCHQRAASNVARTLSERTPLVRGGPVQSHRGAGQSQMEKVRLYVGGLAADVSASDLQERFAPLGNVQSILLPSAKAGPGHRGFAYVDFVPATDASLRKLFSAYNGCKWRGGFLRIEKAKENFTERLQREWAVEAASLAMENGPANHAKVVQETFPASCLQKQVNTDRTDMEANSLKIFFPHLRKLRTVPLKGLGKHKRSFQRVESAPLHLLNTCSCDESLLSGSCNCSTMYKDCVAIEVEISNQGDDISLAIAKERRRQLELLSRLFPSDPSTSLEPQKVVELEAHELIGTSELEGTKASPENPLTSVSQIERRTRTESPQYLLLGGETGSIVGKQPVESFNPKMDSEKYWNDMKEDSTSLAVTGERAKQPDLISRWFSTDAPSSIHVSMEVEEVVQPEHSKMKRKRKHEVSSDSGEKFNPSSGIPESRPVLLPQQQGAQVDSSTGKQSNDHAMAKTDGSLENFMTPLKVDSSSNPIAGGSSAGPIIRKDEQAIKPSNKGLQRKRKHDRLCVTEKPCLPEPDHYFQNRESRAAGRQTNDPTKSWMDPVQLAEDNLDVTLTAIPQVSAEGKERQVQHRRAMLISDDILEEDSEKLEDQMEEDSEMTLNLGDGSMSFVVAEEQERKVLIGMLPADTHSSRDLGQVMQIEVGSVEGTSKTKIMQGSEDQEEFLHERPSLSSRGSQTVDSLQRNDVKICIGQQSHEPSREVEEVIEAEVNVLDRSKPDVTMLSRDKPKPYGIVQVEENTKSSEQQPKVGISSPQLDESKSDQRLTRAAWKSLVGETGRVVFSLHQITGATLPQVSPLTEEIKEVEDSNVHVESVLGSKNSTIQKQASLKEDKRKVGPLPSSQSKMGLQDIDTIVMPVVSEIEVCPFMKSENAEEEWLATKSDLRLDYRTKHKDAARNMRKLRGKRT